jgi:hypothetical protein
VIQKRVTLSLAQWRMLGRLVRGEKLPTDRYDNRTMESLVRKQCISRFGPHWQATHFGREVHACRGFWQPTLRVWGAATSSERDAYKRVVVYNNGRVNDDDRKLAEKLHERMLAAGEVAE